MSKNVIINGTTYSGVSEVSLPVSGGTAKFKDEDEITTQTGEGFVSGSWRTAISSLASEQAISEALSSKISVPENYNGWILIRFGYSSAPTQGSHSYSELCAYISGGVSKNGWGRYFNSLKSVSIGDYKFGETGNNAWPFNTAYLTVSSNHLSFNAAYFGTRYIPAGATVEYAYIPIDFTVLTFEGEVV